MPTPRNAPSRSSHRRNSLQDDTPARARAGRAPKPAPSKTDPPDAVTPKASPTKLSPTLTRKATRSASNMSGNSFEAAPEIYASYEDPLFMVFGLSPDFFNSLKKHHGKLPKERKVIVSPLLHESPLPEELSESESALSSSSSSSSSSDESEAEAPTAPQLASRGRGRGGRGGRGVRGRGGRGRGRVGRGRGGAARTTSPVRTRPARTAAPMFPLTEEDDDQPTNQTHDHAKPPPQPHSAKPSPNSEGSEDNNEEPIEEDDSDSVYDPMGAQTPSLTPVGSPPSGLLESILDGTYRSAPAPQPNPEPKPTALVKLSIPKISLPTNSASQTPHDSASTPADIAVPRVLDPEDDVLSESDLPEPWVQDAPSPIEAECEDRADYLLQKRFKPMTDVQAIITALTKFPPSQRSTESLYALAKNTQKILKEWQDEFLMLDARTAPHMHPPKKASNGGRIPVAPEVFDDMKEADLYGYNYDPKKPPGCQNPWAQRPGAEKNGGRELRTRRARDMLDSAAQSEEDEEEDNEGRPTKRQRKAPRKFDGTDTGTGANTPKKHNGWGGARKKGVSKFAKPNSETPEPEGRSGKRARTAATNLLHQRIQEMREESVGGSSGDDGSSIMDGDGDDYSDANPKRGRPAGSKNVARRSDYGIKKGPRKKTSEVGTPTPSAHGPNAPPPALNSMSEGQNQFTIDTQPLSNRSLLVPTSAETVFQASPQPPACQDVPLVHPNESSTPDAYMITAPLSQYTNNYIDDSTTPSGSRRKPRVKSEKRSQSMTIWWAERKARKREEDEKNGTPAKTPTSRSNSVSRKGGRPSGGSVSVSATTPQHVPSEPQQPQQLQQHLQHSPLQHPQQQAPQESYASHYTHPPPQHYMYVSAPPPQPMMMQYSPLAALPTGSFPSYSGPAPPTSQYGPRALAPAPMPLQQVPTYPSPYGPQSPAGSRPKSSGQPPRNGPPALAPAPPQHFSPYAPITMDRFLPYKGMLPSAPADARRESR